ncbi:uncharacterized protein LOC115749205 [Rhodamnia argentea]|uniref:Uncharacterized protein LOC115749205 n=1 Tax=Rhodamnia argentea TaxID=178133 RepID=A0ABM3HAT3_9MYRT|nr:uncharacterized protein LOC115749205 [Rhodamnia argentea]
MMEYKNGRGHVVLPILYKVETKDVEHQLGMSAERFWSRKKHLDEKVVDEWEEVFTEITSLKGWDSRKDVNRLWVYDEAFKVLENNEVVSELKWIEWNGCPFVVINMYLENRISIMGIENIQDKGGEQAWTKC